jgi:hypothetical protein
MHTKGPSFSFSFLEGGVVGMLDFCCSQCSQQFFMVFLSKFPMCFQNVPQVSNVFLNNVPNSTLLYVISLALSSTLVTCTSIPKRRDYVYSILGLLKV